MRINNISKIENLDKDIKGLKINIERELKYSHYLNNGFYTNNIEVNIFIFNAGIYFEKDKILLNEFEYIKNNYSELYNQLKKSYSQAASFNETTQSLIKTLMNLKNEKDKYIFPSIDDRYFIDYYPENIREKALAYVQLNNLYFNSGAILWDGTQLYPYPDIIYDNPKYLKHLTSPIYFIGTKIDGTNGYIKYDNNLSSSYSDWLKNLTTKLLKNNFKFAVSSKSIIYEKGFTNLEDTIKIGLDNDTRHWIYHPYYTNYGALLYEETSNAVLEGRSFELYNSFNDEPIRLELIETLSKVSGVEDLTKLLNESGYNSKNARGQKGYFKIFTKNQKTYIEINLLRGIYNHLILGINESGKLMIIQTSGISGNISGKNGMSYEEIYQLIKLINKDVLIKDKISCCFYSCSGKDVDNVYLKNSKGKLILTSENENLNLNVKQVSREFVTSPRIIILKNSSN